MQTLGGLLSISQFFVWRLDWNPKKNKFNKTPCYLDGSPYIMDASLPSNWLSFAAAMEGLARMRSLSDGYQYALGFYLTANCGYWFLDVDNCVVNGELTPRAEELWKLLPGAFWEWSSSNTGLHFIGRGPVPEHAKRNELEGLELYTDMRGIAFGLSGESGGSADSAHTHAIAWIAQTYFPPRDDDLTRHAERVGPRDDWRGPLDDEDLIRRAMASKSAANQLGGKASFADLWTRNVAALVRTYPSVGSEVGYGESDADAALASHLAFWTGCDPERMERLMRRSALARPKWDEHRTYLRKLTIGHACAIQKDVCQDRPAQIAIDVASTDDQHQQQELLMAAVAQADERTLRNEVIPAIAFNRSINPLDRERLAKLIKEKLATFDIPVTMSNARRLIQLESVDTEDLVALPFAATHVYVMQGDCFFDVDNGVMLSRSSFNALYNREMPVRGNGKREDAAEWCLERWGTKVVTDVMYHPSMPALFEWAGQWYANTYRARSVPIPAPQYTERGIAAINLFQRLLMAFCDQRADVFQGLMGWLAHNVQYPGVKIRWAPILKGIEGDGKSVLAQLLRTTIGHRNLSSVGPATITNSGGFTDWAGGRCVVALEELKIEGRSTEKIYAIMQDFIANDFIQLNRKGKSGIDIINVTNYLAFTNHVDAIPLNDTDRRWFVIFSPYFSLGDLAHAMGVLSTELSGVFGAIYDSMANEPGQWAKWLREWPIAAEFDRNSSAPRTAEKQHMRQSSRGDIEQIARSVIEDGALGVTKSVVSSSSLVNAMKMLLIQEGLELPKTNGIGQLLTKLGFTYYNRVQWRGATHRVWLRGALTMNRDDVVITLDSSALSN